MKTWIWIVIILLAVAAAAGAAYMVGKKSGEKKGVEAYLKALKAPEDPANALILQNALDSGATTPKTVLDGAIKEPSTTVTK